MNKKNMLKLATFLEENISEDQFAMANFRANEDGSNMADTISYEEINLAVHGTNKDACGTIGCALGWGPFCKGLEMVKEDFNSLWYMSWNKYCMRVLDIDVDSALWSFLFTGDWEIFDDSKGGAVSRLRYAVAKDGDLSSLACFDDFDLSYELLDDQHVGFDIKEYSAY